MGVQGREVVCPRGWVAGSGASCPSEPDQPRAGSARVGSAWAGPLPPLGLSGKWLQLRAAGLGQGGQRGRGRPCPVGRTCGAWRRLKEAWNAPRGEVALAPLKSLGYSRSHLHSFSWLVSDKPENAFFHLIHVRAYPVRGGPRCAGLTRVNSPLFLRT